MLLYGSNTVIEKALLSIELSNSGSSRLRLTCFASGSCTRGLVWGGAGVGVGQAGVDFPTHQATA